MVSKKPGRNENCPCGAGLKWKNCCGAAPSAGEILRELSTPSLLPFLESEPGIWRDVRRALERGDDDLADLLPAGQACIASGKAALAVLLYRRALVRRPDIAGLHMNLAVALQLNADLPGALAHARTAARKVPASASAHATLATMCRMAGDLDMAEQSLRSALALDSSLADVWADYGDLLGILGKSSEASTALDRAVVLAPARLDLRSALIMARLYVEDEPSTGLARDREAFDLAAGRIGQPLRRRATAENRRRDGRIRVGYVSADLREHSVVYFIEPVLREHDRQRFEVFCYHLAQKSDGVTARLQALSEHWRPCAGMDEHRLAQMVCDDDIDVLVDLAGHTAGNRLGAFAMQPARLHVSWIGFPGATGLSAIDAEVCDSVVRSRGASDLVLPRVFSCYQPAPQAPDTGLLPMVRQGYATFGSFNNAAKISDQTVDLWSGVLRALPEARLVLKNRANDSHRARESLLARFSLHGIASERISLWGRERDSAAHLSRYGEIDIALDTFPYCGVTTTCEALWMGVPVVTLAGRGFAARTGKTLVRAAGYPHWAVDDARSYVQTAVALATDRAELIRLRGGLRDQMRSCALLDAASVTRSWEDALMSRLASLPSGAA